MSKWVKKREQVPSQVFLGTAETAVSVGGSFPWERNMAVSFCKELESSIL